MSQHALGSDWAAMESGTFRFRDPTNKERRFIPLRLDDAEIKDTLKQFAYIDWRHGDAEQFARLLAACRAPVAAMERADMLAQQSGPVLVLRGHTDHMIALAISEDGKWAATGGYDKTVRVWSLETGKLITTIQGHSASIRAIAVTPDCKRAITGSWDKMLGVWDLKLGKLVKTLHGHSAPVSGVAITTDGRRAVSSSYDQTVWVWDLDTMRSTAILTGHSGEVTGVAMTPDGRRAVSVSSSLSDLAPDFFVGI